MPPITVQLMIPTAVERFQEELRVIYVVKDKNDEIVQSLKQKFEAIKQELRDDEQLWEEAKVEKPKNEALINERRNQVQEDERRGVKTVTELEIWMQESLRQIAVKYCIAFENFLRDFIVEQALLKPEKLESYICERVKFPLAMSESQLPELKLIEDHVVSCVSVEYRDFQELQGRVNGAYKNILGKEKIPFGAFNTNQQVFTKQEEWIAARDDILLLFKIRHQIIHRNGRVNNSFSKEVNDKYEDCLNETFKSESKGSPFTADAILKSPAVGKGHKIDEFAVSLEKYADYITQICG